MITPDWLRKFANESALESTGASSGGGRASGGTPPLGASPATKLSPASPPVVGPIAPPPPPIGGSSTPPGPLANRPAPTPIKVGHYRLKRAEPEPIVSEPDGTPREESAAYDHPLVRGTAGAFGGILGGGSAARASDLSGALRRAQMFAGPDAVPLGALRGAGGKDLLRAGGLTAAGTLAGALAGSLTPGMIQRLMRLTHEGR